MVILENTPAGRIAIAHWHEAAGGASEKALGELSIESFSAGTLGRCHDLGLGHALPELGGEMTKLCADGGRLRELRALLADDFVGGSLLRMSDHELIDQIAGAIRTGRLKLLRLAPPARK